MVKEVRIQYHVHGTIRYMEGITVFSEEIRASWSTILLKKFGKEIAVKYSSKLEEYLHELIFNCYETNINIARKIYECFKELLELYKERGFSGGVYLNKYTSELLDFFKVNE